MYPATLLEGRHGSDERPITAIVRHSVMICLIVSSEFIPTFVPLYDRLLACRGSACCDRLTACRTLTQRSLHPWNWSLHVVPGSNGHSEQSAPLDLRSLRPEPARPSSLSHRER